MPITIAKTPEGYTAEVTPPHCGGVPWSTPRPMQLDELIDELIGRGCHRTDIGDALYAADPDWVSR